MRIVRGRSFECERACEWVSLELDTELSEFERTLLGAHLAGCAECRTFRDDVAAVTSELRSFPLEQPERAAYVARRRRRMPVRLAPAAAAFAALAVGLGSLLGALNAGNLLGDSVGQLRLQEASAGVDGNPDLIRRFQLRRLVQHDQSERSARLARRATRREGGLVAPTRAGPVTKSP